MIKTPKRDGSVLVTFELPAAVTAESVSLCGDFNDWSETSHPLNRTDDGFKASVELAPGQRWRFRYLLDGARWENDWAADDYIGNEFGGEDSIVDLTDTVTLGPSEPPADTDKPSGTRRRKAATDAPAASAPTRSGRTAPAAESAADTPAGTAGTAGTAGNGKPKRAAGTTATSSTSSATATTSAAEAGTRKPATTRARKSAAAASDVVEKKPATSRRKPASSRESGKDT